MYYTDNIAYITSATIAVDEMKKIINHYSCKGFEKLADIKLIDNSLKYCRKLKFINDVKEIPAIVADINFTTNSFIMIS